MSQRNRQSRVDRRGDPATTAAARGFTLVELLVVMVIISILLGFILNAAMGSVKQAQLRATQSLITKLEGGLNDRLDALMQSRPDPRQAHTWLASVFPSYFPNANMPNSGALAGYQRAQVIAWYDYIKSEMPDTFFVQLGEPNYKINFAGNPYPLANGTPVSSGSSLTTAELLYVLPMGNSVMPPMGDGNVNNPEGTGIYGASYAVAAGLYKNLGFAPQGYDGVDNNQNGMIDDWSEGVNSSNQTTVLARLGSHKHNTARAEMLYAILVEGRGPLGSVFNADDFTEKEVQDTDGDGLPEFVNAWGNPLQFFRWPLLYHSDIQRGQQVQVGSENNWALIPPYQNPAIAGASSVNLQMLLPREQDPLDLNQQLVAPMWWSAASNANTNAAGMFGCPNAVVPGASGAVAAFEFYFHRLSEPLPSPSGIVYWNRDPSNYVYRRAFYSKFLVVSGGLDGELGVFIYSDAHLSSQSNPAWSLIANENNALPFAPTDPLGAIADFSVSPTFQTTSISYNAGADPNDPSNPTTGHLLQAAQDDISNQNIQATVAIGGS